MCLLLYHDVDKRIERRFYHSLGDLMSIGMMGRAQRLVFSRRLAALVNATDSRAGKDTKTQKTPDLARRKAVGCNTVLARCRL
jgi:hypothetical protein